MTAASLSPFLREGLAVLETSPIRRLAARMAGPDQSDVLADVALKLVELDRRGKATPDNVAAYVQVMVRHACLAAFESRARLRRTPVQDPAMSIACPGIFPATAIGSDGPLAVDAPDEDRPDIAGLVADALGKIPPEQAMQVRLTYYDQIRVRDTKGRGVSFGTAVTRTRRGCHKLRLLPEIDAAAEKIGVGPWGRFLAGADHDVGRVARAWVRLVANALDHGDNLDHAIASTRRAAAEATGIRDKLRGWTILAEAEAAIRDSWPRAQGRVAA